MRNNRWRRGNSKIWYPKKLITQQLNTNLKLNYCQYFSTYLFIHTVVNYKGEKHVKRKRGPNYISQFSTYKPKKLAHRSTNLHHNTL